MPISSRVFILTLIAITIFALGFGVSTLVTESPPQEEGVVWQAWDILQDYFVDPQALDDPEVLEAMIQALREGDVDILFEAIDDPYTSHMDAEAYRLFLSGLQGSYGGIGTVLTKEADQLVVVRVFEDSPAEAKGIEAGDVILEINGEPAPEMSLEEAAARIRGEPGTMVALRIQHDGETREVAITRAEIQITTVSHQMLDNGIAHIEIISFSLNTPAELIDALEYIEDEGATAIILDLRDNPGGLLISAEAVASQFLDEGDTIYWLVDREGNQQRITASGGGLATEIPMVVLVNGYSASSSEIVAGALQDNERATIIGTQTFGKGSINQLIPLEDGSALYVTICHWLTPKENQVEGVGITPDIVVEGEDEQLLEAVDILTVSLNLPVFYDRIILSSYI